MPIADADALELTIRRNYRLDCFLRHLDVLLINHTNGPNMPLLKLRLRAVYALIAHQETEVWQMDVQLPIDCVAYNVDTEASVLESLLEPLVLALRTTARPRQRWKGVLLKSRGLQFRIPYNASKLDISASPINMTLTQSSLRAFLVFLPSLQQAIDETLGDAANTADDTTDDTAPPGAP